jgi:pimeloyl-ACP methyl ester carboxylesterase
MGDITHRTIETNGIRMHVAEAGNGPLVLLCHGFPESWYSWRHQLRALAEAGYRAVAPDMRGYGKTDAPEAIDQYTLFHLTGDMVGLLDALGEQHAVVVGHDWGAPVAWHCALFRPDRFRAVVALSVPFRPRVAVRPTTVMPQTEDAIFYQLHFQTPGVAEADLESDHRSSVIGIMYANSGDGPLQKSGLPADGVGMVPRASGLRGGLAALMARPDTLPGWLTGADADFYAAEFARTGFRGGLNWYRNIDRNWELMAPFAGARVTVPALCMIGELDLTMGFRGARETVANMSQWVPQLRETVMLPGCGHWTQQERPNEVNAALIAFLGSLGRG